MWKVKTKSPKEVIEQVSSNDASVTKVDLNGSATYQMKSDEYTSLLAEALKNNTSVTDLALGNLDITDKGAADLGAAIAVNKSVVTLDLEKNKLKVGGSTSLAEGLKTNATLRQINLLNQTDKFSDQTLDAFIDAFQTNVTLLKITWRLDSRKSFALTKLISRNNEIDRRVKAGMDYTDLLPDALRDSPPVLGGGPAPTTMLGKAKAAAEKGMAKTEIAVAATGRRLSDAAGPKLEEGLAAVRKMSTGSGETSPKAEGGEDGVLKKMADGAGAAVRRLSAKFDGASMPGANEASAAEAAPEAPAAEAAPEAPAADAAPEAAEAAPTAEGDGTDASA